MKNISAILVLLAFSYCSLLDNTTRQSGVIGRSISNNKIWQDVGGEDFSDKETRKASIVIYEGIKYRSFIDPNGNKLSVMQYNEDRGEWDYLGARGFRSNVKEADLAVYRIGENINIYVVLIDPLGGNRASVLEYDSVNEDWEIVGYSAFSPRNIFDIRLVVNEDKMYVAYKNPSRNPAIVSKVMVQEFITGEWCDVGPDVSDGEVKDLSLILDGGVLYVGYIDMVNGEKVSVKKFNSTDCDWDDAGEPVFTAYQADRLSFTMDPSTQKKYIVYTQVNKRAILMELINGGLNWIVVGGGELPIRSTNAELKVENGKFYLAYKDQLFGNSKASMIGSTDGVNWNYLGNTGISQGAVKDISLVVESGVPYLAYKDESLNNKVTVKKYDVPTIPKDYEWNAVGTAGFSAGSIAYTSLAFAEDGTPYIAYQDGANSSDATVMKYNGTSWENVGPVGFSVNNAYWTSLVINKGVPYVAYRDDGNGTKATVMRYNEDIRGWSPVGNPGFTASTACFTSLAFDNNDTPYVAYYDAGNSSRASVMRYNGSAWVQVGPVGFSGGSYAYNTSLVIDSNNVPYVAFGDTSYSSKARVMKFNGTSWVNVGLVGFSAAGAPYTSLAIDQNDNLYLAYQDGGHQNKASVMKFDGVAWQYVGIPGFSAGGASYTSLKIAPNGTPYVGYRDDGNSSKATVMKYNGTEWVNVSTPGFSSARADHTSLAIAPNGTPYVGYSDSGNSSKATVMKLEVVQPNGL